MPAQVFGAAEHDKIVAHEEIAERREMIETVSTSAASSPSDARTATHRHDRRDGKSAPDRHTVRGRGDREYFMFRFYSRVMRRDATPDVRAL
jgi:hypothetical protein